ncbi:hypothetical protein CTI12_AA404940 [Artemisia annua]|uniref:Uncharacterized protein n=1 Tax=Artemisia annua TaxID=35608 RepID=A0A2U1M966_ARTAN|nr:hypothetical protein CTI12_AA404940 [Artemisia annua]
MNDPKVEVSTSESSMKEQDQKPLDSKEFQLPKPLVYALNNFQFECATSKKDTYGGINSSCYTRINSAYYTPTPIRESASDEGDTRSKYGDEQRHKLIQIMI